MSDTRNNGGPAFPQNGFDDGMILRDWFAGQALAGIIPALKTVPRNAKESADMISGAAKAAYMFSDAMLAAREAAQ